MIISEISNLKKPDIWISSCRIQAEMILVLGSMLKI